ncbi:MAG: hypothetical protein LBU51_03855, partial [Bacteroidales bacterium]|nr:hypothetical protein [Bacteroidales bacterium]
SFHFGIGVLISFPLWYIILFIVGLCLFNWWVAVIGLVVYPVSFLIYLRSKIIVKKQLLRFRRFGMWWRGDTLYHKAKELRNNIIDNLNKII